MESTVGTGSTFRLLIPLGKKGNRSPKGEVLIGVGAAKAISGWAVSVGQNPIVRFSRWLGQLGFSGVDRTKCFSWCEPILPE